MAGVFQKILGGASASPSPVSSGVADADFADFQSSSAEPSPASIFAAPSGAPVSSFATGIPGRPYTKWYRVWERAEPSDFIAEAFIVPFLLLIVFVHLWGVSANRKKAKSWFASLAPVLRDEFAQVGFKRHSEGLDVDGLTKLSSVLEEKAPNEFVTFATGRQNIAFVDLKLTLIKRYNPFLVLGENLIAFFFESMPVTVEQMEAAIFPFDGREKDLIPGGLKSGAGNSSYDNFVWAIVHKDKMKELRQERYDLSLTSTKDHPKLPPFYTVMTENAEVTEALLTDELVKAITDSGESLVSLIVSDQPVDAPQKLDEVEPKKRLQLTASTAGTSLLPVFIRLADQVAKVGHFRPEVQRKLKATRETELGKLRKLDDEEKAEKRKENADKKKKDEREKLLKGMSAEQQRKFLDREREKDRRKGEKKRTMRG